MASYKTKYDPSVRSEEPLTYSRRPSTTRIPTRSITPTSASRIPTIAGAAQGSKTTQTGINTRTDTGSSRMGTSRRLSTQKQWENVSRSTVSERGRFPVKPADPPSRRLAVPALPDSRTPSLVSGSTASVTESPKSHRLRHKPSGLERNASRSRADSTSSCEDLRAVESAPGGYQDPYPGSVLGFTLPSFAASSVSLGKKPAYITTPSIQLPRSVSASTMDPLHRLATEDLPPPTPLYTLSASPSTTRYTESPAMFSHTSTPTSMSSASPQITTTSRIGPPRARQPSPTRSRPPVTRRKTGPDDEPAKVLEPQGLPSVRESSSSSSASTIRMDSKKLTKERKPRLPDIPPTPPLRTSSKSPGRSWSRPRANTAESQKSTFSEDIPEVPKTQPHVQAPPELAHLNVDNPISPRTTIPTRPRRPSRDNAPGLMDQFNPSPVIQSNLPANVFHRRQSSSEGVPSVASATSPPPASRSRFGFASRVPSRNPSPNPSHGSTFSPPGSVGAVTRGTTPELKPVQRGTTPELQITTRNLRKETTPTTASAAKASSRFGFFRRKTEDAAAAAAEKTERAKLKKGPMAGTGHEGYGRHAIRGRSGSMTSVSGSLGRSASADSAYGSGQWTGSSRRSSGGSNKEPAPLDDFLAERLNPVILRGEGTVSSVGSSPQVVQSSIMSQPQSAVSSVDEIIRIDSTKLLQTTKKPSLLPSAINNPVNPLSSPPKRPVAVRSKSSDTDERYNHPDLPSLAARRSRKKLRSQSQLIEKKVPLLPPIDTKGKAPAPKITSYESVAQSNPLGIPLSESENESRLKIKKYPAQPKAPRKWNFFQRAHASPKKDTVIAHGVPVAIHTQVPARVIPHYAVAETSNKIDLEELERIMREADIEEQQSEMEKMGGGYSDSDSFSVQREYKQSMLLPSPPTFNPEVFKPQYAEATVASPTELVPIRMDTEYAQLPLPESQPSSIPSLEHRSDTLSTAASEVATPPMPSVSASPPRSRLAPVGRIPQVVSRRDRDKKVSSQSFSRPFVPILPPPGLQSPAQANFNSLPQNALPPAPLPQPATIAGSQVIVAAEDKPYNPLEQGEFLKFSPRKGSEISYSSSSGILSFPFPSVAAASAVASYEDDIWNEYDDLIDDVMSLGKPESPKKSPDVSPSKVGLALTTDEEVVLGLAELSPVMAPKPFALTSLPEALRLSASQPSSSPRARMSRLPSTLLSATSEVSISDFFAGYGERNLSVIDPQTGRISMRSSGSNRMQPITSRLSLPVVQRPTSGSTHSRSNSLPDGSSPSTSGQLAKSPARPQSLVSMANLRFGALMTSKWLSFGRVFFSPVDAEIKNAAPGTQNRVLIMDGTGRDWSYYCALTYPTATIYSLDPTPSTSTQNRQSLPNHHHIHHPHLSAPFPFPRGFFAAVIFRFPTAASSSTFQMCFSECKRVLQPGGYIEISLLDIDLMGMGNRCRRAVRRLKERMQARDGNVCLQPMSDCVQRMLGRRGFEGLNRCVVGVPVEGCVRGSRENSMEGKKNGEEEGLSFTELLSKSPTEGEGANGEAGAGRGIADMVAKVGRWWYSQCYERVVLDGDAEGESEEGSIWDDRALLRECEKRQTSFRLLICYAQKPAVTVRRTVSV